MCQQLTILKRNSSSKVKENFLQTFLWYIFPKLSALLSWISFLRHRMSFIDITAFFSSLYDEHDICKFPLNVLLFFLFGHFKILYKNLGGADCGVENMGRFINDLTGFVEGFYELSSLLSR